MSPFQKGKDHKGFEGKRHSKETRELMSKNRKDKNNSNWKGDKAGYKAIHIWVNKNKLKPKQCEVCGGYTDDLDLSNISGDYKRDVNDYEYICRSCHWKKDKKILNIKKMVKHYE